MVNSRHPVILIAVLWGSTMGGTDPISCDPRNLSLRRERLISQLRLAVERLLHGHRILPAWSRRLLVPPQEQRVENR